MTLATSLNFVYIGAHSGMVMELCH